MLTLLNYEIQPHMQCFDICLTAGSKQNHVEWCHSILHMRISGLKAYAKMAPIGEKVDRENILNETGDDNEDSNIW